MNKADEYVARIRRYDRASLLELWRQLQNDETGDFPSGKAFEHLILRAFELESAEIKWPYSVPLGQYTVEQIDGVIYTDGLHCLVEAKDYTGEVDVEPIAKLRNQLLRRPGLAIGLLFAKNGFTEPAKVLSSYVAPQTILLWEQRDITFALTEGRMREGLKRKLRYAVEQGLSYFDLEGDR